MSELREEKPSGQPLSSTVRRPRSSLRWTLGICVLALGYGAYLRWQWQKTQHPLQLRVLQMAPSDDKMGEPFLKIHINGAPVSTDDYFVQGPQWQVNLNRLQWRKDAASPWQDAPPQLRERMQEDLAHNAIHRAVADGVEARWERQYWLHPGEHRIEGQFHATFYDDNQQNWEGSVQIGQSVAVPTPGPVPTPTLGPKIQGIADIQYHIEGITTPTGPNSATVSYQGKMADAQGNALWKSVPRRGQNGFPLTLANNADIWFRAIQKGHAPSRPRAKSATEPI